MKNTYHLSLAFLLWGVAVHALENPPNIILVMADDMGMGDTSAFQDFTGNPDDVQLHTPQMERLARMGMIFTDAHTSSSRCTTSRYSLLTGRYPWRNRLKSWVLFGSQGDPMIEADRPTLATLLRDAGYSTAMVGKWHVGLRYRRSDGSPAAGWDDADLSRPLHTSPVDHGFDYARITSRSHKTSGPVIVNGKARNFVGPGHIHGREAVGATGKGQETVADGPNAFILEKLGSRHSDHAMEFLGKHVADPETRNKPFFLYYPSNSNHAPYTPDKSIGGVPVAGAAKTKSGASMDARHDYIYENDVALGRLLDWLETTKDPRQPDRMLIETSLVIFTSDNGAEKNSDIATGPFRSNKGSVYEGGHRVPFIISWPGGGIGDGKASTPGLTNDAPISLQDLYATFAEIIGSKLPDLRAGQKGAEDSFSVLPAFHGKALPDRPPLFFHDHKEAKEDPAVSAVRIDSPRVNGKVYLGKWKLFFDPALLRAGEAHPYELYNLAVDSWETKNLIGDMKLKPLIQFITSRALLHRNAGGHRLVEFAPAERITFAWNTGGFSTVESRAGLTLTVSGVRSGKLLPEADFKTGGDGLGIRGGKSDAVDAGEALLVRFDKDVLVESAAVVAGDGVCGGFYRVGDAAPLAIYCVDADIDENDQSGILSDIGVLKAGDALRLDSSPHYGVEATGQWRLRSLTIRKLN